MIKVLLIDQTLGNRNSIRAKLNASGTSDFKVDCVTTQQGILNALRHGSYDVCMLDSILDNGAQLQSQVRAISFTVPIVLVVGNNAAVAMEAMRNGVADCLIRDQLSSAQIERTVCGVAERMRHSSMQSQRERRHLALLDNATAFVYTHDLDGNFTSINRVGERLTGYAETELLAMKVHQIIMPEYKGLVDRMIERALDAQAQVAEEIVLCTSDGTAQRVQINIHPIQHLGQTIEIQGVARAIDKSPRFKTYAIRANDGAPRYFSEFRICAMPDNEAIISGPLFSA